MKNPDRIYAFFVVLALLFWNPACFYLFYHAKPVYQLTAVHLFYWVIFIAGIIAALNISKGQTGAAGKNAALILAFTGILFAFLVTVNVAIGRVKRGKARMTAAGTPQDDRKGGLVFEPNSKAVYHTTEFNFSADINSLGLREREIKKEKGDRFRILCVGDSWTFGWGVDAANSWPRKLEDDLHKAGKTNVEVINCGRGGQYTTTYKQYLADAVPMLKPDLVLVGVLEEDDLAQLYETNFKVEDKIATTAAPASQGALPAATEFLKSSFGNILALFSRQGPSEKPIDIRDIWKGMAAKFYEDLDHIERLRFNTLDDTLRQMFLSGNINPGLVDAYVKFPDRVTIFNNPSHPATQYAIAEMKKDIGEMKAVCDKNGAAMVFVNLPINFFNGHQVVRSPSDVLNPWFETNNKIDSIYASVAQFSRLPYIQLTEYFKALPDKSAYYFKYDGHPNERGYAAIASYIAQQITEHNFYKTN